ncbi:MAG: STAS domain-containing protein [Planctomycetota bacterium]|jgi:anti-sigma B factor antagonist
MTTDSKYFLNREVQGVQVLEFSRSDILDAMYIKELGDEIYEMVKTMDAPRIVVDLQNVHFLSSAALGMFLALNKVLRKQSGHLRLSNVDKSIYDVFRITKLNKVFHICDSTEEALESFA